MIFETMSYTDNDGNTISIGDTTYPATDFDMKVYQKNTAVSKMQFPGRWPTFSYPEYREIHVAGDILGSSASDYNTKVKSLKAVVNPPYRTYTGRRHGTLALTFFGDAATYYAYVILSSIETPKVANYPSVGSYEITWISFEPYLFTTGGVYARNI